MTLRLQSYGSDGITLTSLWTTNTMVIIIRQDFDGYYLGTFIRRHDEDI